MATPELSLSYLESKLIDALAALNRKLELADEIENPIERFFKQEKLLE